MHAHAHTRPHTHTSHEPPAPFRNGGTRTKKREEMPKGRRACVLLTPPTLSPLLLLPATVQGRTLRPTTCNPKEAGEGKEREAVALLLCVCVPVFVSECTSLPDLASFLRRCVCSPLPCNSVGVGRAGTRRCDGGSGGRGRGVTRLQGRKRHTSAVRDTREG